MVSDENNKGLLDQIGDHVRGEQKDDARFESVARGEATREELKTLEREDAIRLAASRPLSSDAVDRIAARITKQDANANKNANATEAQPSKTNVIRASFDRRVMTIAGPLAIAAALVLYMTTATGPATTSGGGGGADMPLYSISATGEQEMRAAPSTDSPRLHLGKSRDARFEILLRPASASTEKVVAYAFAMTPSGSAEPLDDAKIEVAPGGAVKITGAAHTLEAVKEIRVVIGAPASIGKFDDAAERAKTSKTDRKVRVLSVAIDRD